MKKFAFMTLALAATSMASMAAEYRWDGGGAPDNNWGTGTNWNPDGAPSGSGHTLYFEGPGQTTNNNQLTSVGTADSNGIVFSAGAGAFTLEGNNLTFAGNIVNNSTSGQTFNLNLGYSRSVAADHRSINTRYGDITINGIVSGGASNTNLYKDGLETLKLTGANTGASRIIIRAGTLELDASTGSIETFRDLYLGVSGSNTSTFVITGDDYISTRGIAGGSDAATTIKADGVHLTFASFTTGDTIRITTNFDVSTTGSSISFSTNPITEAQNPNRIRRTTVTDISGKTGFATTVLDNRGTPETTDDVYTIARRTGLIDLSTNPVTDGTTHAFVDTSYSNSENRVLNTLTIQGAGTFSGTGSLSVGGILMEEGTGNYTFSNARVQANGSGGGDTLYIHQYSTDGILTFDSPLTHAHGGSSALVKTGPGTVLVGTASVNGHSGATHIQGGEFVLDGGFTRTGSVTVYDGATLSGAGAFGATSASAITVRAGGTLSATSERALTITGTLTLQSDSAFTFTLGDGVDSVNVSGDITLGSNVTLALALDGTLTFDTPLYLLRSEGETGITGNFVYQNAVISDGATFTLGGYEFRYFQDNSDIWVTVTAAIPEPSSLALVFGAGMGVLLLNRRRKRRLMP